MTGVCTLASGSSGNASVFFSGEDCYLIDAGISCRRILAGLARLGFSPEQLCGILITHTHSDHISGMRTLLKKTTCPIYATRESTFQLSYRLEGLDGRLAAVELCKAVSLSGMDVIPIPTSHDSSGSCGFRVDCAEGAFGILTDSGFVTGEAREILPGANVIILEANHDVDLLRAGPYPYYLKDRILGPKGHLSNESAAEFAAVLALHGAEELILAHLSQENNTPALALSAVAAAIEGTGCHLSVAPRDCVGKVFPITRRVPCRG